MLLHSQKGAVAPLIAVLLLVIVVCVAFVVDLGHVHNVKAELQRAVDAAALAGAKHLPNANKVKAVAIATAAANTVGQDTVLTTADDVVLGLWDKENLTATASERFTPSSVYPNAVYVRATRTVEHIFFFFVDATQVTADAIAVTEPINPVLPLAMVTCIPIAAAVTNPGALPGTDACDIKFYNFNPDNDDSGAWTSLTLGANANDIRTMLESPAGLAVFQKLVFGLGLSNDGLENTVPPLNPSPLTDASSCRPYPQGENIDCGLGKIAGKDLAAANEFTPPASFPATAQPMPRDPVTGVYLPYSPTFDPMTGYAQNRILPRWYNLTDDAVLMTDDHFTRIWSLDGHLLKAPNPGSPALPPGATGETFVQYQQRLGDYYNNNPLRPPPTPFDDGRLVGSTGLIRNDLSPQEKTAIRAAFGLPGGTNIDYWPNYERIVKRAGYPKVGVINGTVGTLLQTFLENPMVINPVTQDLQCRENPPLSGNTLKLQVPVIFAGFCETWQAISSPAAVHNLVYVGLADFLVTRAYKTPGGHDCGGSYVSGAGCGTTFNPPLVGGEFRYATVTGNVTGFEGLVKVPVVDESEASSIVRTFLVE